MVVYAPGTLETDPKKQNMALQQLASAATTLQSSVTANTASIATNSSAITALQTPGTGLVASGGGLAVSLSKITASLGADVALNNTANYFDGPSVAQGTSGTWFVSGSVGVLDTAGAAGILAKLWDGTTVIASAAVNVTAANLVATLSLSGFIASPSGNLRISCRDLTSTSGKITFNTSGNSKDGTITAFRLA